MICTKTVLTTKISTISVDEQGDDNDNVISNAARTVQEGGDVESSKED